MNRKYILTGLIGAFCAFMLLVDGGCGNAAPYGSKVIGPTDGSVSVFTATTTPIVWELTFIVVDADENPMNGIDTEISCLNGSFPEYGGATYYTKKTDSSGTVKVFFAFELTAAEVNAGLKAKEGYVWVSTKTSGAVWKITMSLKTS